MNAREPRLLWWHAAALVAICTAMFWTGLGWRSFASSEGHRVAPAWEMLDSGNWWRVSMFGHAYLRKPPGMPWAIAAMSSLFGQNEFAARSVSALSMTLSVLAAWWFASRWFGPRMGIVAGFGLIIMPQLWSPARSAEIEALNNLGTLLACFAILDRVLAHAPRRAAAPVPRPSASAPGEGLAGRIRPSAADPAPQTDRTSGPIDTALIVLVGALGLIIAVLAKGPASAPVLGAVLLVPAFRRMWTRRANLSVLAMAAIAAAVIIPLGRRVAAATIEPGAITQSPEDFFWSKGIGPVLMLAPMALVAALPTSLAFMFPWGRDARAEADAAGEPARRALDTAQLFGLTWMASLGIMVVFGMGNHRYAMPAACLLAPLPCYVIRGVWGVHASFHEKRRLLARRLMLGKPMALPAILISAAVLNNYTSRRFQIGTDGRKAGRVVAAAASFSTPVTVCADGLIEARPDVLLYARQSAAREGFDLRPRWTPVDPGAKTPPPLPAIGAAVVLRVDPEGDERPRYEQAILDGRLVSITDGRVGRYEFRIFRSVDAAQRTPSPDKPEAEHPR